MGPGASEWMPAGRYLVLVLVLSGAGECDRASARAANTQCAAVLQDAVMHHAVVQVAVN